MTNSTLRDPGEIPIDSCYLQIIVVLGYDDNKVPHPKKVPEKSLKKCTGFAYCGPKLYNKLPSEIKESKNIESFKTLVKDCIWKTILAY